MPADSALLYLHLYTHFLSLNSVEFLWYVWRNSVNVCGKGRGRWPFFVFLVSLPFRYTFWWWMWAHSLPYPHTSDSAPSTSAPAFSLWLQKRGQAWRDPFCMAGAGWEEATGKKRAKQRKSRKKKRGGRRREKRENKAKWEVRSLVHSISFLNQVSIAMGPAHCQVSGESTGKWKWQREGGRKSWLVKWWAVESKMNGWKSPGIKWSLPEGKLMQILRHSCLPQQARLFPRGSPCLISLCL